MVRELKILRWCEICFDDGRHTEAAIGYAIACSPGDKLTDVARLVDLCEDHRDEYEEFFRIVRKAAPVRSDDGSPPPLTESSSRPGKHELVPCPLPGCDSTLRRSSLFTHMAGFHKLGVLVQPTQCPTCTYASEVAPAMGVHRARRHGHDLIAEYVKMAAARDGTTPTPTPTLKPRPEPEPEPQPQLDLQVPERTTGHLKPGSVPSRILALARRRRGTVTTEEFICAIDANPNGVRAELSYLVRIGWLVRVSRGVYTLNPERR